MRLSASLLTTATLLLTLTPAALADSFQVTLTSSVQEHLSNTSNDNIMGIYQTAGDAWGTQSGVNTTAASYSNSPLSNISFSVPTGNTITSATLELIFLTPNVTGTADVFLSGGGRLPLHRPDTDNPVSIAPTFSHSSSSVRVDGLITDHGSQGGYQDGSSLIFDLSNLITVDGGNVFTSDMANVQLLAIGQMYASVETQGYNFASYIGGDGQASLPYELELVGTYSPVPEPSTIVLLSTGFLGMVGVARRKFLSQS